MQIAAKIFEASIAWLRQNYSNYIFYVERDIVWSVQTHLISLIKAENLPYKVHNDFPMLPGNRRSLSTDLAILGKNDEVLVAAEFKYEPSHKRNDILAPKFPVTSWGNDGIGKDVERVKEYVAKGKAIVGYSIFIDEGTHYQKRTPHLGSTWIDWSPDSKNLYQVSVLWSKVESK